MKEIIAVMLIFVGVITSFAQVPTRIFFSMERNARIDKGRLREGIYIIVVKTQDNVYRNTIIKRN